MLLVKLLFWQLFLNPTPVSSAVYGWVGAIEHPCKSPQVQIFIFTKLLVLPS
jgi:hypothetical protein